MGGKTSTISNSEQRILSLQVQQSSQGLTLPVVYGRTRVSGNLIWYGDFVTIEHKTETRQGGKGGGGVKQVDIKYTYEAAVMMALCEGEIKGVTKVWRDKEKFAHLADLRLNLARGGSEQPTWAHLQQAKHRNQALNYSDTAYVYAPNYELTNSAQIYSHNFEVDGKLGYSAAIVDANPRDILVDLLTNHNYGCGFPTENMGDTEVFSTYCRAAGIFLSPAYNEQTEAHQNITELLEQTNSAAVFSQGRLKIVPYGDAQVAGNGAIYTPNLTPLYDLTDDDFIVSGAEDPVSVERKTNADAFNQVQVEYLDRSNDYNIAVAEAKDQANIEQYGLRPKDAIQMHAICDARVAQQVAQLVLQRALYVRNEYEFKLGWKYVLLEPMDLVTLTDEGLGLDKTPVRIIEVEEDEDGVLTVRAEDFPFGTASATAYPTQPSLGYSANYNVSPGNAHAPVMFEAPLQLTNNEPQIWLATAGGENWGGAEVWVSTDGDSYVRIGSVNSKARYGTTQGVLAAGAVFDNVNTLPVQIGAGHLDNATENDARDLLSACYVDGEFLAYETANLTGVGQYTLSKLVRGAWGSDVSRHAAGKPFARLDSSLFKYTFDRGWLGKTIWVKLVSFNVFGSGLQDLSEVPAYPYTIVGAPLAGVANLRLTSAWAHGRNATIAWDKLDGADSYDVEIYAANSQTLLRSAVGVVDNQYTYTLADMKADGGQVRNVVFKVRGRAVTGKTGKWTQIVAQNPQLQALQGIKLESGLKQVFFTCETPKEEDFAGICVWVSENAAVPMTEASKVYEGADTYIVINKCNGQPLVGGKTYYVRAAGYDAFGKDGMKASSSTAFTVFEINSIAKDLSESNLATSLRERINLVDGSGANSVNARLQNEAVQRANEIKAVADKAASDLLAKAGEIGNRITAVENVDKDQAQKLATVTAAQGQTAAALEAEKKARADGDKAEAQARTTLAARVSAAEGSITREETARITADRAQTEAAEALKTRVGSAEGSIAGLQRTLSDETSARAEQVNALSARFDGLSVGGRNLLLATKDAKVEVWNNRATNREDFKQTLRISSDVNWAEVRELTLSCNISFDNVQQAGSRWWRAGFEINVKFTDGTEAWPSVFQVAPQGAFNGRKSYTYVVPKGKMISSVAFGEILVQNITSSGWIKVGRPKLEIGNVVTDWTPAPEDSDAKIAAVEAAFSEFKEVQARADEAQTTSLNRAESRLGNAEAAITNLNTTKAGKGEVVAIARTGLQSEWQGAATQAKDDAVAEARRLNNATNAEITKLQETVADNNRARAEESKELKARFDGLQLGGRNLLLNSADAKVDVWNNRATDREDFQKYLSISEKVNWSDVRHLTLSCDISFDNVQQAGSRWWRVGMEVHVLYTDETEAWPSVFQVAPLGAFNGRKSYTFSVPKGKTISRIGSVSIKVQNITSSGWIKVGRPKLEIGNVVTDWTPAPEDGDSALAVVLSKVEAEASKTAALSRKTDTMQTTLDGHTTSIQQQSSSIDGLKAQYTVKIDNNGSVSGFGLASEPVNGTPRSKFIVTADSFGVGSGNAKVFPFVVDTAKRTVGVDGSLVVNGQAIVDKLNAGAINGDKIAANSLNANRLTAGSITAREIAVNVVNATHLAANSVNASHLSANSVSAEKMSVSSLSAISSNLGEINGGHINIGNGNFIVDWAGNVTANNGRFGGTVYADRIEGDVLKMVQMERVGVGHYRLNINGGRRGVFVSVMNLLLGIDAQSSSRADSRDVSRVNPDCRCGLFKIFLNSVEIKKRMFIPNLAYEQPYGGGYLVYFDASFFDMPFSRFLEAGRSHTLEIRTYQTRNRTPDGVSYAKDAEETPIVFLSLP